MKKGVVLWFTGLSGSGKTSLSRALKDVAQGRSRKVTILDGDAVRDTVHRHLSFSKEDILENNRRLAEMSKDCRKKWDIVIVSVISPFREGRKFARELLRPGFLEVYVRASLETCIRRDAKGLYKRALAGEIPHFIGVSDDTPYEEPTNADIVVDTEILNAAESLKLLVTSLEQRKIL